MQPAKKTPAPSAHIKKRWLALLGAVVALAGVLLWREVPRRWRPQAPSTGAADSGAAGALLADYRVGDVLAYALSYEAAVDTSDGGRYFQLATKGDWTLTVLEVSDEGVLLAARLTGAKLKSTNARPEQAGEYEAVERSLAERLFVQLDRRGAVRALRLGDQTSSSAAQVLRAVVTLGQSVTPDAPAKRWQPIETDVTGKYLAQYQQLGGGRVSKRKHSYIELHATPGNPASAEIEVVSSEGELVLDERRLLRDLYVREAIRTKSNLTPAMTSTTMLRLTRKPMGSDPSLAAALLTQAAGLRAVPIERANGTDDFEAAIDRQKVAGRKYGDFMAEWRTLPRANEEKPEQRDKSRRLFVEFAALLRNDDQAVDQALNEILDGSPLASTLWDALAAAGSSKAQEALRQLIEDDRFDDHDHRLQLLGLSFVQKPTPETVQYLMDKVDDPEHGQQARFGIGTALNHLSGSDHARAERGVQTLLEKLDKAEEPADVSDYLRAVGNAADPSTEPVIAGYVNDEEAPVRAAAASALRFMTGQDVTKTLASLIKNDPDPFVRAEAIDAAGLRTPDKLLLDAVYDASVGDRAKSPRERAIAVLGNWRRSDPALDQAVAQFEQSVAEAAAPASASVQ